MDKRIKTKKIIEKKCNILASLIVPIFILYTSPMVVMAKAFSKPDLSLLQSKYNSRAIQKMVKKAFGKDDIEIYNKFAAAVEELEKQEEGNKKYVFPYEKMLTQIISEDKRVDVDKSFYKDIINHNNRLDYYDLYIKLAKQRGYIVTSYIDYLEKYKNTDAKVLILRHDIDISDSATKLMFDIEKENNVKATYYFRWSSFNKELIKEIASAGFEVGLHYETIATYCIDNKKNTLNSEDIIKCREILKEEIEKFKTETGINIQTISSHGNPVNKKIGVPNYVLLIGQNYKDYGIVGETYDKNIIRHFIKSYICDGEITKNAGFSYSTNPINSILRNEKVIEFLSHPNHWNYDIYKRAILQMELKNGKFVQ